MPNTDVVAALSTNLALEEPKLNRWAVCSTADAFLKQRSDQTLAIPAKMEVSSYLSGLTETLGRERACTEFAFLQIAAARIWGADQTSHFAIVLREARVLRKAAKATEWDRAITAIEQLPSDWRAEMIRYMELSRAGGKAARGICRWSASHTAAVARALATWRSFCIETDRSTVPNGSAFESFGRFLLSSRDHDVSVSTVAHYLARIYSGFACVLLPGFTSIACEFVLRDWRERGDLNGTPTKTADQLVSAAAIYELGYEIMHRARCRRTRSTGAAIDFRNGLLLATAIALPQRARALSVLEFDKTLSLVSDDTLHVRIPGQWIKQAERLKEKRPFNRTMKNPRLSAALAEYERDFRPIFDQGSLLFPSSHAPMQGLTESSLGKIAGDLTADAFNVRISIHRFRDCVATEICEMLPNGGWMAPPVLGHRNAAITGRHYDHSVGYEVACEFGNLIDSRRSEVVDLLV